MRLPRRAWLLGALPALALACQLVDPASDLRDDLALADGGGGGGGAADGSLAPGADASITGDAGSDATTADAGDASDADANLSLCQQAVNLGAALCDDFNNRSILVPEGGPNWAFPDCAGDRNPQLRLYSGAMHATLPTGDVDATSCYVQSLPVNAVQNWTLTFDLTGSVDSFATEGDASDLTIAQLDFAYDASAPGAVTAQSFQLFVGTDNSARLDMIQTRVGVGASTRTLLASPVNHPFLAGNDTICSIKLYVEPTGPQDSKASSTCPVQGTEPLNALTPRDTPGASGMGAGVLQLGFEEYGGTFPAVQDLAYDNVVLVAK